MEEAATQTDKVTIVEAATIVETPEKTKSKLPPWAKPWKPPPCVLGDPKASTPTDNDDQRPSKAAEDTSNVSRPLAGEGSGGLDWINATVTGKRTGRLDTMEIDREPDQHLFYDHLKRFNLRSGKTT